ncbi:MAG: NUDIX domain-containing protein [Candidatus Wildermuthbacteria bacterium]|nr:NUDIX domain-containing protein [Candidatus Wildermuthbacteria bacterium]
MVDQILRVNVDILVIKDGKILFGLLTKDWNYQGKQVYGVPGSDIRFGEKIGETIRRNIKEEIGCSIIKYKIICVNANHALGNHYIGIGAIAEIDGEPKNKMPEEWVKWEWFGKDEIPDNLFPPARNLMECYLKNKFNISE